MEPKVVRMTPQWAERLLETKAPNRNLSELYAKRLANEMRAGRWVENGETIKLDVAGKLIDGQHRLMACVLSGVSFNTCMVENVNEGAFDSIDCGRRRTIADVFSLEGETASRVLAAAVTMLWRYQSGDLDKGKNSSITPGQAMDTLNDNPGIRNSVVWDDRSRRLVPGSISVCFHYLFAKVSQETADEFWEGICTGNDLRSDQSDTAAVLMFRNRMIDSRSGGTWRMKTKAIVALLIKAWNYVRQGKVPRALIYRPSGEVAEPLPRIL